MKENTDPNIRFEERDTTYALIFPDGLVLEKNKVRLGKIDPQKSIRNVIASYKRDDERWVYYVLWSDGMVEKKEKRKCLCGLPKAQGPLSPAEYEMFALLLTNWVKKGKLTYTEKEPWNTPLEDLLQQFDDNNWLGEQVEHTFECKRCSDSLILSVDTYRGGGKGFYRKEKEPR